MSDHLNAAGAASGPTWDDIEVLLDALSHEQPDEVFGRAFEKTLARLWEEGEGTDELASELHPTWDDIEVLLDALPEQGPDEVFCRAFEKTLARLWEEGEG